MNQINIKDEFNPKTYFTFVTIIILFKSIGLSTSIIRQEPLMILWIHFLFVILISGLLICYPYKKTNVMVFLILFHIIFFFYFLFLIYPNTTSTLALIYIAPIIAIIFSNRALFVSSLLFNLFFGSALFIGLSLSNYNEKFSLLTNDITGNLINFWVCQVIICFIFMIMSKRLNKTKEYFQRVQKAERSNTVGQLAAVVAHEIRNPLTIVKGFLQLSAKHPITETQMKLMISELDRAESTIRSYLSLLKPELNEKKTSTNVSTEIQAVTDLFFPFSMMTKNEIKLDLHHEMWVNIPSIEIKQLLTNIIKNALESMESSGVINVKGYLDKKHVVIEIHDTGIGMTELEVSKLGTPFYSLKQKGTGIGLTICFDIVEKYKGQMNIKSKKSIGTMVQIYLPKG